MATITLNSQEFIFTDYSRTVNFGGEHISDSAYINNISGLDVSTRLRALGEDTITSLVIKYNDEVIYSLTNLNAQIISITEGYSGGETVTTGINIRFND